MCRRTICFATGNICKFKTVTLLMINMAINKQEKYVLCSTAMKLQLFFKKFEEDLLARLLFFVHLTEMIVTAFHYYYSNVSRGFFGRQNTRQFCCVWQCEKGSLFLPDMTNIPFISTLREFR